MKLQTKIFGAFLLTMVFTIGLMVVLLQQTASDKFADYINQIRFEKHPAVRELLQTYFQQYRSWEGLRNNPRLWRHLKGEALWLAVPEDDPVLQEEAFLLWKNLLQSSPEDRQGHAHPSRQNLHHTPEFQFLAQLSLFDREQQWVAGTAGRSDQTLSALQLQGEIIGWLGLPKAREFSDPLESRFLRQQIQAFYWLAGLVLLVAGVAAFLLSRQLLLPIRHLIQGTQAITNRNFETRIQVFSQDELGNLARNFNTMAETLGRYEEQRKNAFSEVLHELNTPLSILRGEIEALEDGIRPLNAETLASLHQEVMHLSRMVHDFREISLSELGVTTLDRAQLDLRECLERVLNTAQLRLEQQDLQVRFLVDTQQSFAIIADWNRLKQLFTNLLENTLRYTQSPGQLEIRLARQGEWLVLSWEDSPPGVPEESLPQLFQRFYRVDKSRSRALGGSGLGLAVCKSVVEMHQGRISAHHSALGGLKLMIELPLTAGVKP